MVACNAATSDAQLGQVLEFQNFTGSNRARFNYEIQEEGITIRLCVQGGHVVLYASFSVPNPNKALNSFVLDAIIHRQMCEDTFIPPDPEIDQVPGRKKRQLETDQRILYVSIEGVSDNSQFTLEADTEDTTQCKLH